MAVSQFRQFNKKKGPQSIRNLPYCKFNGKCRYKRRKSRLNGLYCAMYPDTCNQQVWGEMVKNKRV